MVDKQKEQLDSGLAELKIELLDSQKQLLLNYLVLLNKWNQAYNLTAVRDPDQHVSRHILDSLAVMSYLKINTGDISADRPYFLDVGTGAGLPGIPLAIALPQTRWALLDSNGKKTRFLTQCKMELGLDNIEIIHSRVKEFKPHMQFEGIISRAFSTIADMIEGCRHLLHPKIKLYAMKGLYPADELGDLTDNFIVENFYKLQVPDCEAERHLLIMAPVEDKHCIMGE